MSLFSSNFQLILFGKAGYLLIAAVLVAAFTIFIYRRTNPVVPAGIRYTLIALRILSLAILLLLLFESTARWILTEKKPPILAVAIDTSASMGLRDARDDRPAQIRRLAKDLLPASLPDPLQTKFYRFAGDVREIGQSAIDSLTFNGDATDISSSLEAIRGQLQDQNLAAMLLVTDGNYTDGGNPLRYASEMDVPLHVLGVGDSHPRPDLSIARIEANAIAFAGESTPVHVSIHSQGFARMRTRAVLRDESGEIENWMLPIRANPDDSTLIFSYKPAKAGRQKLVAEVSALPGEISGENNRKTVYIDVLKSHLQVLVLAGLVSADISFLRNQLQGSGRFDLRVLAQDAGGAFTGDRSSRTALDSLDQYDLFVWQNFPTARTARSVLSRLQESLQKRPRPLVLFAGEDTDWPALAPFSSLLPMEPRVVDGGEMQVLPQLSPAGRSHPIMQIPGRDLSVWNLLPPVFLRHQLQSTWPDAEVLAYARPAYGNAATNCPLVVVRSSGQKSVAVMAYDLWRWHLMMAGIGNDDEVYYHFINQLIRWLQIERNTELIRLQLDKPVYRFGETINVDAYVLDAQFKPIDGARARLVLGRGKEEEEFDLTPAGNGKYTVALRPDRAGDYALSLTVEENGQLIGTAKTQMTVGEYNRELSELTMQEPLLLGLAQSSGGRFAPIDSAAKVIRAINGKTKFEPRQRDIELWNRATTLAAIILLLTAEWFLRKRKGMV